MNVVSRAGMTAYYVAVGTVMRTMGYSVRGVGALSDVLGTLRYHVGYVGRNRSRQIYLDLMHDALPGVPDGELRRLLKRFWRNHQRCFLELFVIPHLEPGDVDRWVEFRGLEHLDTALAAGRGAILAVPHYGNERFVHIALAMRGYPMSALSAPYSDYPKIARNLRLDAARRFHHVGTLGENPRWIYERLARNEVVQIAPTGEGGARGIPVELLGHSIEFASGPARIVVKTGAAFVPAFISWEHGAGAGGRHDGRYVVEIVAPLPVPRGEGDPTVALTRAFARVLEERVRRQPEPFNWMWWVIRRQETHAGMETRPMEASHA